jgi:molecular chaperone DnaK
MEVYSTMTDFQERVHIQIFQGEAELCEENAKVGSFLHEISDRGPAGQTFEVEMSYNLDGMVDVVARDPKSGHRTAVRISPDGVVMSEAELRNAKERMSRESGGTPRASAASSTGSTAPQRDWRDSPLYPQVAALLSHAEQRLSGLSGAERVRVNHVLNELKAALSANDEARVRAREDELTDVLFELD